MNSYLTNVLENSPDLLGMTLFHDFLGINWSGAQITFMNDFAGFMQMLLTERVPDFMPEPVWIDREEDVFAPETPFEVSLLKLLCISETFSIVFLFQVYIYFVAFRVNSIPSLEIEEYQRFLKAFTDVTPGFEGQPPPPTLT